MVKISAAEIGVGPDDVFNSVHRLTGPAYYDRCGLVAHVFGGS